MELSDYAQALGAAQRLVPNWREGDMQEAQLATARMQPQLMQAQIARSQAQTQQETQEAAFKEQRRAAFQSGLTNLGGRPTPQKLYQLSAQFPEFATQIQGAAKGIGAEDGAKVVRYLAPIQSQITNGKYEDAAKAVKRHIDADVAAGSEPDESDQELYDELMSGDPARQKAAGGIAYGLLAALNPETAPANINKREENAGGQYTLAPGSKRFDANGKLLASADFAPDRFTLSPGETRYDSNSGGGDPASSGGAAGARGDVSRLINSDAGGGYVPEGVKTLGQFVGFGKDLNRRGAKSSSAGTYQINGTTMAEFAPKALGADWKQAPFNADTQERVGEAIFNWAKQQPDPAKALRGRWVSLDPGTASRLVQGSWQQARGVIAQGETGGGAGASAAAPTGGGARVVAQAGPKPGYRMLSPDETAAQGLDPNVKYQAGPDGQITALGGQSKAQLKQIPTSAVTSIQENISTGKEIDRALLVLKKRPSSIGPGTGTFGDTFTQFNDPEGTDVRAAIGKIGGQIIHDVSGAAVTLSEEPRFRPYVPTITDRPSIAVAKLKRLKQLTQSRLDEQQDFYGEANGYRPYKSGSTTGNIATVRSIQQANALPPGTLYRAPDGKVRRR